MDIKVEDGKLFVDGVIQSAYPPPDWGYWQFMVPDFEPKNVLILGAGLGTIAQLIRDKYPDTLIILGIEINPEITELPDNSKSRGMLVIETDAFEYIYKLKKAEWDLIIVDLWNGGWFNIKVLQNEFLDQCKKILTANGKIYINAPDIEKLASIAGLREKTKTESANIIYETT